MNDRLQDNTILTWADVSAALDALFELSQHTVDIVDRDLSLQGWESPERIARIEHALVDRGVTVRILLADLRQLEQHLARLTTLVRRRGKQVTIVESSQPEVLVQSMVVVDKQHGLTRPDPTRSYGRIWRGDLYRSKSYEEFFNQVWRLGGRQYFPELHGL
jgi:phosphatidylserine/phosphatidylglycerophosphate/cardiolipin synthase-like enzyme